MFGYLGAFVKTCGPMIAKATISYGADVVGSHVAYNELLGAKQEVQSAVESLGGKFLEPAGDLLGRAVAGHGIDFALNQKDTVTTALGSIGNELLNASDSSKLNESYSIRALNIASQAGSLAVPVAMACGALPVGPSFIASAVLKGGPALYKAFTSSLEKESDESTELLRDVMVPAAADLAIGATGALVQGAVVYNEITYAHDTRIELGEKLGRGLTGYFPTCVQNISGQLGKMVATVDAPRHALSEKVVGLAAEKAGCAKTITELGLQTISSTVRKHTKKKPSTFMDIARNTAVLGAGILGGGALFAFTPAIAPYIAGAALLNVAPKAVLWTRKSLSSDSVSENALSDDESSEEDWIDLGDSIDSVHSVDSKQPTDSILDIPIFDVDALGG